MLPIPAISGATMAIRIAHDLRVHDQPSLDLLKYLRCPAIHEHVLLLLLKDSDHSTETVAVLHDAAWRCADPYAVVAIRSLATVLAYLDPITHATLAAALSVFSAKPEDTPASFNAVMNGFPPDVISHGLELSTSEIHSNAAGVTIVNPADVHTFPHPSQRRAS
jgi:hypothetical protein